MGIKLEDLKRKADVNIITDRKEIYDICKDLIQLKMSDLAPSRGDTEHNGYIYAIRTILNEFKIDISKHLNEMSFEEFIYLCMIALDEGDFDSSEDALFPKEFHKTRCFRDLQVQKLSEGMLNTTHNSVIRKFLRISVEEYLYIIQEMTGHKKKAEDIKKIIMILQKQDIYDSDMTMKEAFELAFAMSRQPWIPGTLPLHIYVSRAKMNVNFIAQLLADNLSELFKIVEKYDAQELLNKYESAFVLSYAELLEGDEDE